MTHIQSLESAHRRTVRPSACRKMVGGQTLGSDMFALLAPVAANKAEFILGM